MYGRCVDLVKSCKSWWVLLLFITAFAIVYMVMKMMELCSVGESSLKYYCHCLYRDDKGRVVVEW